MIPDETISTIAKMVAPDDLPGDLPELAEIVGVEDALRIATRIGCGRIYLRRWTDDRSQWSPDMRTLVDLVGVDKAREIAEWFGGAHLDIPRCDRFWRAWRNRCIQEAAGDMRQIDLARMHGLSDRQIRNIQKSARHEEPTLFEDL